MKKLKLLITGLTLIPSLALTQDYIGYFWTPELENGFFREKIALFKDSTFHWIYCGDLAFEETSGTYHEKDNIIILDVKPHYDTIKSWDIELQKMVSSILPPLPYIYDRNEKISRKYLYRKNRLFTFSKQGKKSRHAKFIKVDKEIWKQRDGVWIENGDSLRK
jgi:hypothetical protein